MDIRLSAGQRVSSTDILPISGTNALADQAPESTAQAHESLANIAIFNLLKQRMIFGELQTEFNQLAKMQMPDSVSFIKIYSYKPAMYLGLATLAHLRAKKFGAAWLLVHGSALMLINQWDMNQGMRKLSQEKWSEYEEALKNYELALKMTDLKMWDYLKQVMQSRFSVEDYGRVLSRKPH